MGFVENHFEKCVSGVTITSLALHLSMLIVGAEYNSEEQCKLEASEYISPCPKLIGIEEK